VQKVPLKQLSLDTLIEFIPTRSTVEQAATLQQAEQAATTLRSIVFDYFRWLGTDLDNPETVQPGPRSLQPELGLINTLLAVAQFKYRHEVADSNQDEVMIPLINELHKLKAWLKSLRGQRSNLASSKKRLDWFEFLDFVEQLRKSVYLGSFKTLNQAIKGLHLALCVLQQRSPKAISGLCLQPC
jgi:hypothetical protein